jgi:hypothetical protein
MKPQLLFSVLTALTLSMQARAALIPGVYSTGVDNSGVPLAAGTIDPHYTLTLSPSGPASAKVTDPYWLWMGGTASSSWINSIGTATDAPDGDYIYSLTFSLAGLDHTTASISGLWASDNASSIYLNGVDTGFSRPTDWGFVDFDSFTLNSGFLPGVNTLSFFVRNEPNDIENPSGLQVQITSAIAAVPEPGSLTLLLVGACGALALRRARSK